MTESGFVDGCGADASWHNASLFQNLDLETAKAWDAGHREMMRMTTSALGEGVLLGKV